MAGRKSSSKPRVRIASFDGLEPVIVVLPDGSIRLFSHDNAPLSARTVLSEFPSMSLASLDCTVSPSAPLVPGETYFLTPRRASIREEASLIRLATPPPAAWTGGSAFRAPATLPPRSPRAVSDGEIPLIRSGVAGGWAYRRDLEASVANVSFNHAATLPTSTTTTAVAAAAAIEPIQAAGLWSRASSSSSSSSASGSMQSRGETLETYFAAHESFGSGRGSSLGSGRADGYDNDDDESDWSQYDHDGPSIPFNGRHGYYTDDSKAHVRQNSSTYSGAPRSSGDNSGLHTDEAPSRCHMSPSPRATPNAILAELAVLEEELPLDLPLEEPDALAEASAWCSSSATGPATSGGASRAPRAPPPAVPDAASLKGKVLAAIARFNPRHLRRAVSTSSSGKEAMAAAPPPGSVKFARRQRDLPPPAMGVVARRGISHMGVMYDDDAESSHGWVDVEGPVLMMTDTCIRHRAPPGFRSSTGMGRQGGFAQQDRHSEITGTQFSTGHAGGINPSALRELQRAPSLEAAQRGERPFERCDEWHSYASGLTPRQRAQVRLSEDSMRDRRGNAAVRNEYAMLPSERYLSGPPLQATY